MGRPVFVPHFPGSPPWEFLGYYREYWEWYSLRPSARTTTMPIVHWAAGAKLEFLRVNLGAYRSTVQRRRTHEGSGEKEEELSTIRRNKNIGYIFLRVIGVRAHALIELRDASARDNHVEGSIWGYDIGWGRWDLDDTCSSSDKPWELDSRGRLFLPRSKRSGKNQGPPSLMKRPPRKRPAAALPTPPSKALTRIRYRTGKRDKRDVPLEEADLYVGHPRPPFRNPLAGHKCRVCGCIKSHPVVNKCGHSYCYVCIRLRLEEHWTCPHVDCNRILHGPPAIDVGEEDSVKADYPDWVDESQVSYTWDGLRFPRPPKPIVLSPPSSPF
ncbi:hypothetical protein B0H19DRAFT_1083727 [Mycena capillaripes]|nr:hypothetical protein B0H19DRAFT_1083727 [Mycena capillaripes]